MISSLLILLSMMNGGNQCVNITTGPTIIEYYQDNRPPYVHINKWCQLPDGSIVELR